MLCVAGLLAALACLGPTPYAFADDEKREETPCFYQRDPEGDFDRDGSVNCGPVAVSNGLIYLENARGLEKLVDDTDYDGQIELIAELAEEMETDKTGGTYPDQVLTGIQTYVRNHGYACESLEIVDANPMSAANKKYHIGASPKIAWMTEAAEDPDAVMIMAVGWCKKNADGTYSRSGGHWVTIVGAGPDDWDFDIHNPWIEPERQAEETGITFTGLGKDFTLKGKDGKNYNKPNAWRAYGPGLELAADSTKIAILDTVIVFRLQKDGDDEEEEEQVETDDDEDEEDADEEEEEEE